VVLGAIFCQEQNIAPKIQILHAISGLVVSELKAEGQSSELFWPFLLVNKNATRTGIFIHDLFMLARISHQGAR